VTTTITTTAAAIRSGTSQGRGRAEIVFAAATAHAPLITGTPEVSSPGRRDRLYAEFRELGRRLAAAQPDLLVLFVNDHLQNFA
jgi:hypothetical protein